MRLGALLNGWRRLGRAQQPGASRMTDQRGGQPMENVKMSLCPACTACPEIEIAGDEVRIGEAGNLTVLKKDEWNVLVDLIQSGQLTKV